MPGQPIEVIPVLDLRGGVAVRARQGLRHSYAPILTPLARTSAPGDVVAGFLALHPFHTIYIADLDAIERRGSHDQITRALCAAFPGVTFWVDAGVRTAANARLWLARHERAHLVLGSESLDDPEALEDLSAEDRIVLSLDYRGDQFLGPEEVSANSRLWPARVIVMTLARVGGLSGPDMDRLSDVKRRAPEAKLYAAGGLRGFSDLMRLKEAGIGGVLVASALHDGLLTHSSLAAGISAEDTGAK